ncbi:hypothetical protein O0Q50_22090 [Priestia aryabhattai]|uniref:Uncharacterized protein n=1 Tax=Priestia aryabhattai TaxID=412384 RepID=A0AAX6NEF3_PRIAR|nr:hypothetical protein [Priestia aryabhattai]MDU9693874.1 hypothetical protein [Priestia aryabhattai]
MNQVAEKKGIDNLDLGNVFKYEELVYVSYTFKDKPDMQFTYYLNNNTGNGVNFYSKSHTQWHWSPVDHLYYQELKAHLVNATEFKEAVNTGDMYIQKMFNDVREHLGYVFCIEQAERVLKHIGCSHLNFMHNNAGNVYFEATKNSVRKHICVSMGNEKVTVIESNLNANAFTETSSYTYEPKKFIFNEYNYREILLELYKYGFELIYKNLLKGTCVEIVDAKTHSFREQMVEIVEQKETNFNERISLGISEFNNLVETSGYEFLVEETLEFKDKNKVIYSFSTLLELSKDKA